MQRIIKILILLALVGQSASAQTFPNTDSLRRYIDKYVRNSAVEAFTNLRLNTALKGMLGRVDSVQAQVLGSPRVVDSIWKPNDSTFRFRIRGNIYQLTDRGGSGGGGSVTVDQVLADGSTNAISNNAVFDALAGKANTSHNHAATDLISGLIPSGRFEAGTVPLNALAATGPLNSNTVPFGDGSWRVPAANAFTNILQINDSTILFTRPNGTSDTLVISGVTSGGSSGGGSGSVYWGSILGSLSAQSDLVAALGGKQALSTALTQISGLTPNNDDIIQRKAGVWTNRSVAQYKIDLALTKSDVGLGSVDNTSDANKPVSTATQTALNAKQLTLVSGTNIKTINGQSVLGSGDIVVAGSGGVSQAQVGQQIADSLNANARVFQNAPRSGFDSLSRAYNGGIELKAVAFNNTAFLNWNKQVDSNGISLSPTISTPFPAAHVEFVSSATFQPDLSLGTASFQNKRKYIYTGSANATWVLPTSAIYNGYEVTIPNTKNFSISFNVPVYIDASTTIPAGSQAIAPLGGAILTKQSGSGIWIIDTYR